MTDPPGEPGDIPTVTTAPASRPWHKRRVGTWLISLGAFMVYMIAGQIFPGVAIGIVMAFQGMTATTEEEMGRLLLPYLPILAIWGTLVAVGLVAIIHKLGWLATLPRGGSSKLRTVLTVLILGVICIAGQYPIVLIQEALGFPFKEQPILMEGLRSGGLAFFLMIAVLAPLGEEYFFRRFIFTMMKMGENRLAAYTVTAALFSLAHMNPEGTFLYIWMGCCFCLTYELTGSVWGSIGVHAFNNAAVFLEVRFLT